MSYNWLSPFYFSNRQTTLTIKTIYYTFQFAMKKFYNKTIVIILLTLSFQNHAQKRVLDISYERNKDNSVAINYTKNAPGSYYVQVRFPILENCIQGEFSTVVKDLGGTLLTLLPMNQNQPIRFSTSTSYSRGEPNPKVDKDFVYMLPYKKGKTVKIIEATSLNEKYFGKKKIDSWKSFIVDTKSKDSIFAMRKGIVIEIVNKHEAISTNNARYTSSLNYIIIEHQDGTTSTFKGLNKDSFFVKEGQTVYPQSKLGVLNIFDESKYRLYFHVSYLVDNKNTNNSKEKMHREFVDPIFLTKKGETKLNHGNEFTVGFSEALLKEEFSRREKKKFKKNPQLFQ